MTKFTLSSEQSPEAILTFAVSKGYQQDITKYKEDGAQEIESNPVAPEDFVAQYFTQIIVNEM